ncbi:MAG TPA: carboxypeptidase-like regulatory domain-containing protein [Bryobacteraceae bacterium]|nr:carboxypeptidase-like regulatory domain-containing protein [Bryobacteraceae bacterium]
MRQLFRALSLLVLSLTAFAQGDRGTITGTISDPAGAVVANASIEARNVETGGVYPTASTPTGNYTIPQLPAGSYEVSVAVAGFKKYVRSGLTVQVAETLRIDIVLEVGAASESVTVQADATLLKTESGELSHNVTTDTVDNLPILGIGSSMAGSSAIRNPQAVAYLLPGAYVAPNAQMRVNGAPGNTASYRLEGQDASNGQVPATQAQIQPSVDAIQEVTIQTSNFAAEYGLVGGGFFNYTMRSGTNQLHGSAYDYFVNEVFNAQTPWVNAKPTARRNDYGFTVGGPVFIPKVYNGHDKTFFFFNWEQYRETEIINNILDTVPTAGYRIGDFSQALTKRILGTDPLGRPIPEGGVYDPTTTRVVAGQTIRDLFHNNQIPMEQLDPVALKIQSMIPNPNQGTGVINNAVFPFPSTRITSIPAFKIDHLLGPRMKFSYYWSETKTASQYSPTLGGADGLPDPISGEIGTFITARTQRGNFEYTVTPTLLFHFGVGYQTNHFTDDAVVTNFNPSQALGLNGIPVNRLFPFITGLCPAGTSNGTVTSTCGGQGGMKTMGPTTNRHPLQYEKPTANTSVTWVHGNHTYKAGGELRVESNSSTLFAATDGQFTFSPNETGLPYLQSSTLGGGTVGFAYASFLLGLVDQVKIAPIDNMKMGKHAFGAFVQDTWKVTRRLTLDYGIRYDFQTYLKEGQGRFAQFAPNIPNPSAGGQPGAVEFEGYGMTPAGTPRCNCSFANNYPYAIGPRLGVAYQITPKTVFRGGWGIVYAGTGDSNGSTAGGLSIPNAVSAPSFGQPAMTLAGGVPFAPLPFPNWDVGQFPQAGYATTQAPAVWYDQNAGRPARQMQWSLGLQRELGKDLAVEANYVANRGVWWNAPGLVDVNALSPQAIAAAGLNLNNPADVTLLSSPLNSALAISRGFSKPPFTGFPVTATVAQSLRPFPQFNSISALWAPDGNTWYDSLQAKATKRFSHGLQFSSVFTWSRSLTTAAPSNVTIPGTGTQAVTDVFNRSLNKVLSPFDQPFLFTIAASYTVPALHTNKLLSWAARDWQINTLLGYGSGLPILSPIAQNNLNNVLLRNSLNAAGSANGFSPQIGYANRVPGQPLFLHDMNCHCFDPNQVFVLNPLAWTQPGPGQWGTGAAYYNDYRFQRRPNENLGFGRLFRVKERYELNVRIEFNNVFNRAEMPNPTSANAGATQVSKNGVPTAGFGFIATANTGIVTNTQIPTSRQGTVVARFRF